jgi:hypothetical protein
MVEARVPISQAGIYFTPILSLIIFSLTLLVLPPMKHRQLNDKLKLSLALLFEKLYLTLAEFLKFCFHPNW